MRQGFTLIELLVVVAIIGVMMAGALLSLGTGRDIARLRAASRGVAQMAHYANALALLRQRPVIITYTSEKGEDDVPVMRIDVRLTGESMAAAGSSQPADPIYREVNSQDTSVAGAAVAMDEPDQDGGGGGEDASVAEKTGLFFTRQILNPAELAKEDAVRVFEGVSMELELLGEDGAAVDERTAGQLKDQAEGLLNNRITAIKAWSSLHGEIDTEDEKDKKEDEKKEGGTPEKEPDHVIFETNGCCQPHRITLRMAAEDGKTDGLKITVSRTGKVTIGEPEEE